VFPQSRTRVTGSDTKYQVPGSHILYTQRALTVQSESQKAPRSCGNLKHQLYINSREREEIFPQQTSQWAKENLQSPNKSEVLACLGPKRERERDQGKGEVQRVEAQNGNEETKAAVGERRLVVYKIIDSSNRESVSM
jgi:hypothetical protein